MRRTAGAMASAPGVTEAQIRELGLPETFARGRAYFERGAVSHLRRRGAELQAEVARSQDTPNQVHVTLAECGLARAVCTGPMPGAGRVPASERRQLRDETCRGSRGARRSGSHASVVIPFTTIPLLRRSWPPPTGCVRRVSGSHSRGGCERCLWTGISAARSHPRPHRDRSRRAPGAPVR